MDKRIVLDLSVLKKHKLSISRYLMLYYYYCIKKKINNTFVIAYSNDESSSAGLIKPLVDDNWILYTKDENGVRIELRDKVYSLFEGDADLFLEWFSKYPVKTPDGRVLKPASSDTIKGRKLKDKWLRLFRNNDSAARKAIDVLEAEMEYRRKSGKFQFMQLAETWLNQGSFETFEVYLEGKDSSKSRENDDFV